MQQLIKHSKGKSIGHIENESKSLFWPARSIKFCTEKATIFGAELGLRNIMLELDALDDQVIQAITKFEGF